MPNLSRRLDCACTIHQSLSSLSKVLSFSLLQRQTKQKPALWTEKETISLSSQDCAIAPTRQPHLSQLFKSLHPD
ncbi:uncharacterized protein QC763_0102850 [Podospora pseudopauciseta]|uniref:Uncharacterized protein n=1 Tax=Podospora pseudopauciseta TaxID=2093780 RepID=A0ABR0H0M7_9PEZI|nr:hypothetical protein QC763_0102850 [Podospora pseudopauciseta]